MACPQRAIRQGDHHPERTMDRITELIRTLVGKLHDALLRLMPIEDE